MIEMLPSCDGLSSMIVSLDQTAFYTFSPGPDIISLSLFKDLVAPIWAEIAQK